jgi:hypothetical protein
VQSVAWSAGDGDGSGAVEAVGLRRGAMAVHATLNAAPRNFQIRRQGEHHGRCVVRGVRFPRNLSFA